MSRKEKLKEIRNARKMNGLCVVGDNNPAALGKALCEICLQYRRDKTKERKLLSLCNAGCGSTVTTKSKCEKCRIKHLAIKFGLSVEDCLLLFKNNMCMICKTDWPLVIDHDHKTGKVRGVLCKQCNIALGGAKDNIDILSSLIEYLKSPPASTILGKECFRKWKTIKSSPGIIKDGRGYKRK